MAVIIENIPVDPDADAWTVMLAEHLPRFCIEIDQLAQVRILDRTLEFTMDIPWDEEVHVNRKANIVKYGTQLEVILCAVILSAQMVNMTRKISVEVSIGSSEPMTCSDGTRIGGFLDVKFRSDPWPTSG